MRLFLATILLGFFTVACSSVDKQGSDSAVDSKQELQKSKDAETKKEASNKIKCELKKDIRVIELKEKNEGKACEVHYTKMGSTEVIASSSQKLTHCQKTLGKVKENLTSAGFNCSM